MNGGRAPFANRAWPFVKPELRPASPAGISVLATFEETQMSKLAAQLSNRPALTAAAAGAAAFAVLGALPGTPNLALVADAALAIQVHLAAAIAAFLIGAVLLLGAKGTTAHRTLGWIWAVAMGVTAVSSLFIHEIRPGGFSLIHALSGWVIIALPAALYAARRHKVSMHRRTMTGLYFGGMFVAGGFAFLPGRLLGQVFFG